MASVNPLSRELVFKIVYYGPGLCGKTTTLEHLHATAKPEHRGKLVSLATPVDRTLYFDFLPVRIPTVRGMNVRLQLFTVPGQVYFNATRKLVLTGADGVVFVSDSQPGRADANLESLENLRENLAEQGRELGQIPLVFQHNKRDLEPVLPVEELDAMLNPFGAPSVPSSAMTGLGVYEALQKISEGVLKAFESKMPELGGGELGTDFAAVEGGLALALRDATHGERPAPSVGLVTRIGPPPEARAADWPSMPPNATLEESPPARGEIAPTPGAPEEPESRRPRPLSVPASARVSARAESPSGLSFAELWPEGEREAARDVERALASHRHADAIELCEKLVSRIFASAAGVLGTTEAPREPALVPMLLGLDGRRFLTFRALVRDARSGGLVSARTALSAYAFAIDARLARSTIG